MKRITTCAIVFLALSLMVGCTKDDDLKWVDTTTENINQWIPTRLYFFYTSDIDDLKNRIVAVSNKKLTSDEIKDKADNTTFKEGIFYGIKEQLKGSYLIDKDRISKAFTYYDNIYQANCVVPYVHVNNTGKSVLYLYSINKKGEYYEDVLTSRFHYAKEDGHWVFEITSISLGEKEVWQKGMRDTGIILNKK